MEDYVFEDVLAGSTVTCGFPGLDTRVAAADGPRRARTLFFPGCSLINYALPLVKAVYDLLAQAGRDVYKRQSEIVRAKRNFRA